MDISSVVNLRLQTLTQENELQKVKQKRIELAGGEKKKEIEDARLREVARDFESLFTKMLLDSMRKNVNKKEDLLYGGGAQDIFDDMLYEKYSRLMAERGNCWNCFYDCRLL